MDTLLKLALAFLLCLALTVFYNAYYYFLAKRYFAKYNKYIDNMVAEKSDWTIQENKHRIISIFKRAGLKDFNTSAAEPAGLGMMKTVHYSFFDNIAFQNTKVAGLVIQYFKEAMGVFENRIYDSINPICWIETLVFLPRKIFKYLGVGADSLLIKIFQVLWWLVGAASTVIGIVFNAEFHAWLSNYHF